MQNPSLFIAPFLVSCVLAVIFLVIHIYFHVASKESRTSDRHIHIGSISRFGGVAIIASFLLTIFSDTHLVMTSQLLGICFLSALILIFGVLDDVYELSWKWQLSFQMLIASAVYFFGVTLEFVTNPFGGIILFQNNLAHLVGFCIAAVWIILIMNSINWIDGVDGVSGMLTLVSAIVIFFLSLRPEVNQPPIAIIAAALSGSLVAFLLFNINPARIFAGSSGSMFFGFILAVLAFFAGAKIATTFLVVSLPIFDAIWVVWQRHKAHVSIFLPDRRHLHFKLLELGWSQRQILAAYSLFTIVVGYIALHTHVWGKLVVFVFIACFAMIVLPSITNASKLCTKE